MTSTFLLIPALVLLNLEVASDLSVVDGALTRAQQRYFVDGHIETRWQVGPGSTEYACGDEERCVQEYYLAPVFRNKSCITARGWCSEPTDTIASRGRQDRVWRYVSSSRRDLVAVEPEIFDGYGHPHTDCSLESSCTPLFVVISR
eukprot:6956516-Prymnesium_polylepis.1